MKAVEGGEAAEEEKDTGRKALAYSSNNVLPRAGQAEALDTSVMNNATQTHRKTVGMRTGGDFMDTSMGQR